MATPPIEFLEQMLDDLFAQVDADAAVTALALKSFRLYDGKVLPVLQDGRIEASALPALYVQSIVPDSLEDERTPTFEMVELDVEIGLVYSNTTAHKPLSALATMAAMMTLKGAILNRDSLENGFPNGDVDEFEVELGELREVRSEEDPRRILYWDGRVVVRLRRQWNLPTT